MKKKKSTPMLLELSCTMEVRFQPTRENTDITEIRWGSTRMLSMEYTRPMHKWDLIDTREYSPLPYSALFDALHRTCIYI